MSESERMHRRARTTAMFLAAVLADAAVAQTPPQQYPQPQYPPAQQQYPGAPANQMQQPMQQPSPLRQVFANTLASVMQGVGTAATAGIVQGINGSVTSWFDRQQQRYSQQQYGQQQYGQQPYGQQQPYSTYPNTTQYPGTTTQYPSTAQYPNSTQYPTDPNAAVTSSSSQYPSSTSTYPSSSYPPSTTTYSSTTTYPPATTASPATTYPSATTTYPGTTAYPATPTYSGTTAYPTTGTPAYPGGSSYGYDPNATQIYDTQTGQLAGNSASSYLTPGTPSSYGNTLYAGVAYEVHAIQPGGSSAPVNPATQTFRSGQQFVIYYRPSMPGRMEVYNINPLGQQTRIDSVSMAAGQMAKLGPYQFTASKGQESLRLVLMPCSSTELLAATRDIVNVSGSAPPGTSGGFSLASCASTRSVKTRDIAKVAVDGTTGFALDPVTAQEYSSGQLDARELNIVFHHQ